MTRQDLIELEKVVMEEVVKRRKLGGFDVNAETILILSEVLLKLVGHLVAKEKRG